MVKVEENLFTDKRLIRDYEDLADVVNDGHVWIGFSKAAFEEYLKVRGRKRIPDRTLARRVKMLHAVRTKDKKWFYFDAPVPPDVRKKVEQVRIGGRPTNDMILFAARDRNGGTAAWLARPRDDLTHQAVWTVAARNGNRHV